MQVSADQVASRGSAGPSACAVLRAAWRCDCDGHSHRAGGHVPGGTAGTVEKHLGVIQSVTGHRPPTCPWRAFYDPLVSRVTDLSVAAKHQYVAAELGSDPPALLLDGLRTFLVSRDAGERHVRRIQEKKNEPKGGAAVPKGGSKGFVSMKRGRRARRG